MTRFAILILLILAKPATGQVLNEIQTLDLGTVAILSNDIVSTITINKDGDYSVVGNIYMLKVGEPAIFEITELAANQKIYVTVGLTQSSTTTTVISPQQFVVSNYDYLEDIRSNSAGVATLNVGATFSTSGNGNLNFVDTTYSANYLVTINF